MRDPSYEPPKTRFEDLPDEALEDCFGPPEARQQVRCLHCYNVYSSDRMVWYRGLWRCPHIVCGGAGYQFDIFPVDSAMFRYDDELAACGSRTPGHISDAGADEGTDSGRGTDSSAGDP